MVDMCRTFAEVKNLAGRLNNYGPDGASTQDLQRVGFAMLAFAFAACRLVSSLLDAP